MNGIGVPNIVVATNRSQEFFDEFLDKWRGEFAGCHLIVVEDNPTKKLKFGKENFTIEHVSWKEIDKDLGKKSWIIPRRTSAIKSYGFYLAWRNQALFTVTLDDDVAPSDEHIQQFYRKLFHNDDRTHPSWFSTIQGFLPRGTESSSNNYVVIAHGTWLINPDLSAVEQLKMQDYGDFEVSFNEGIVPSGSFFSMCGMNLAFRTLFTPHMYFTLQGHMLRNGKLEKLPINRCDDILAGMWAKRVCDEKLFVAYTGKPYCYHQRASNPWKNHTEEGWCDYAIAYMRMALVNPELLIGNELTKYFDLLDEAYDAWYSLFKQEKPFSLKVRGEKHDCSPVA